MSIWSRIFSGKRKSDASSIEDWFREFGARL